MGENQICGLEEFTMNSEIHLTNLECVSLTGSIYCVPIGQVRKWKNEETTNKIEDLGKAKIDFLNNTIEKRLCTITKKENFQVSVLNL